MQNKFKKGQKVVIKYSPLVEDVEFYGDDVQIKPGMKGKVNIILPNGQYHVEVFNEEGERIAYIAIDEEGLEEL